jgi:hypothetical protein
VLAAAQPLAPKGMSTALSDALAARKMTVTGSSARATGSPRFARFRRAVETMAGALGVDAGEFSLSPRLVTAVGGLMSTGTRFEQAG